MSKNISPKEKISWGVATERNLNWIFIFGFIIISVIYFIYYYLNPNYYILPSTNFSDCKYNAWTGCKLIFNYENESENCWKTRDNNISRYEKCQIISKKQRDCWQIEFDKCWDRFIFNRSKVG